jgi:antibiotic biosynthesis monooxygenase (ABM) superfamily enzyme
MNPLNPPDDPPVTVEVLQQVKPGFEAEFEQVLHDLIQVAEVFEGHLGVNIFRPSDSSHPEYRIVFKFDRMSNLRRWEASSDRQRWRLF